MQKRQGRNDEKKGMNELRNSDRRTWVRAMVITMYNRPVKLLMS